MKHPINLEGWKRKEHYKFFSSLDDPFFGITTQVDFTDTYLRCKEAGGSFFLHSLHFLLRCANETEAFKLRVEGDEVVSFNRIHTSPTIGREDGTFGFGFFQFDPDIRIFVQNAEKEIQRVRNCDGLAFSDDTERIDLIRYSALPWFTFSEMKHAVSFGGKDSVPRISTGRLTRAGNNYLLPLSICVHHGLADGRDIADFIERLETEKP